jgi:alkylhydroperoxidase family enzyme
MTYLTQHDGMDNFLVSLVRDHERYEPIVKFLDNIIATSTDLSWLELEIVGEEVARLLGADYCRNLRKGMVSTLDEQDEDIERMKVLLRFTTRVIQSPKTIDKELIDELRFSGLSDQGIEDLIGWICILQMYSVVEHAFGFEGMPQNVLNEIATGTVENKGYLPSFQYFVEMSRQA